MTATETISQSRSEVRNTLRVLLSTIIPRWVRFVAEKETQGFHWVSIMASRIKFTCNWNTSFIFVLICRTLKVRPQCKTGWRSLAMRYWFIYARGSQPGVDVHLVVHLPIWRDTL